MSEWITDRAPTHKDALSGYIIIWLECWRVAKPIKVDEWHSSPWMSIPKPEPYLAVKTLKHVAEVMS